MLETHESFETDVLMRSRLQFTNAVGPGVKPTPRLVFLMGW
jgi:hypothetical protein